MSAVPQPTPDPTLLSALADGEAQDAETDAVLRAWAGDASVRAEWHAYHLIGDALRSDDLCRVPDHDADFLQRLRVRLVDEPPIVAPLPPAVSATRVGMLRRLSRWSAPVAVAAGVAAVAGVTVLMQQRVPAGAGPALAGATPAAPVLVIGPVERDPRILQYINDHRMAGPGTVVDAPGGGVRSVDYRPEGR